MIIIASIFIVLMIPSKALAIVPHGYPATIIHQMGHIFFLFSCIFVALVIIKKNLHKQQGWRYIFFAEIFFALWNIDAFIGHISEFWIDSSQIIGSRQGWDYFKREIVIEGKEYLYYITKHDHIWLVPGMLMFYLGLREHVKNEKSMLIVSAVLPLLPIILVDIIGSFIMLILSLLCLHEAIKLYRINKENTLWNYMLWFSLSYVIFSFSRSLGHILTRILIPSGYEDIWKVIEPYSGSLNTFTFILIGSVSLFFFKAYETYLTISEDNKKIEAINADLSELNKELETLIAERTMNLMALTVADKIRNPAAFIGWTCRRMLKKDKFPETVEKNISDVIDECARLESIVNDFEKLLKSKQSLFEYSDINEIIRGAVRIVEKEADAKKITLSVNLPDYPLKINTQKNLLRAAFFHIIRNSIEATDKNGRITITAEGDDDKVIVTFSDTGIGISQADIERIFDPFFSTKQHRFGMGLPLVRQIVSEHLGDIKVESEVGKGTTFKLIFPVRWIEKK